MRARSRPQRREHPLTAPLPRGVPGEPVAVPDRGRQGTDGHQLAGGLQRPEQPAEGRPQDRRRKCPRIGADGHAPALDLRGDEVLQLAPRARHVVRRGAEHRGEDRRLAAVAVALVRREGPEDLLQDPHVRIEQRGVHPQQQGRVVRGVRVSRSAWVPAPSRSVPFTRSWMPRMRRTTAAASSSVPKVSCRIAPTVACRRANGANGEDRKPLCCATPAATSGWASCSRMARGHASRARRSPAMVQVIPPGDGRSISSF